MGELECNPRGRNPAKYTGQELRLSLHPDVVVESRPMDHDTFTFHMYLNHSHCTRLRTQFLIELHERGEQECAHHQT